MAALPSEEKAPLLLPAAAEAALASAMRTDSSVRESAQEPFHELSRCSLDSSASTASRVAL
eukprot:15648281-Heterocapsa_arctica.AAC.1